MAAAESRGAHRRQRQRVQHRLDQNNHGRLRVTDPVLRHEITGPIFVGIFEEEFKIYENANFLGLVALYPAGIESVAARGGARSAIKSHQSGRGLPDGHLPVGGSPVVFNCSSCRMAWLPGNENR
ncbi:MAG: hypothetical protein ACI9SE_000111 [Neolewinella sp.]|jgi:hypothetical protein